MERRRNFGEELSWVHGGADNGKKQGVVDLSEAKRTSCHASGDILEGIKAKDVNAAEAVAAVVVEAEKKLCVSVMLRSEITSVNFMNYSCL